MRNDVSLDWRIDMDSHVMVKWECQFNGEDRAGASDWRSVLRCAALMLRLLEFPDGDCLKCFHDIGKNCIMDSSAWETSECRLETFTQTLPTRQECLVSDVPSGAVAQLRGCARMRGCTKDWCYLRPATDRESPVSVQPVTGSLLFGSPLRRVLVLPQPNLLYQGLSWNILAALGFSCRLVWWRTVSPGVTLPAVDQAGAAPAASDPLPGTLGHWDIGTRTGFEVR